MGFFTEIRESALDALFPRRCPLCGSLLMPNERICGKCADNVVYINPPVCRTCGRPLFDCTCREEEHCFERCVAPFAYTKAIRSGIHRLKFGNSPSSAQFFGLFMAAAVRREYAAEHIDIVTSVPMYHTDFQRRGYNQAALLASSVGKKLGLPVDNKVITKPVHNNVQHSLTKADRRSNVAGVFDVPRAYLVRGLTVLLCDDVMTTGSTLDECASLLYNAGTRRVLCVTAAAVVGSSQQNVKKIYV